jgi:hypothetical protein
MSFRDWEMKAGDPAVFAFSLAFAPNPDGADDGATAEESDSCGSFTLWADGENLCAHLEQGDVIGAAHWYMLGLTEWLADNWDPCCTRNGCRSAMRGHPPGSHSARPGSLRSP